jgi:predicted nuclease of predicted toxin-antitoxin system
VTSPACRATSKSRSRCAAALDLPSGNTTADTALNRRPLVDQRILITKDADFVNSFLLFGQPFKLLLVATGNRDNNKLLSLFDQNLEALGKGFSQSSCVEMNDKGLVVHG